MTPTTDSVLRLFAGVLTITATAAWTSASYAQDPAPAPEGALSVDPAAPPLPVPAASPAPPAPPAPVAPPVVVADPAPPGNRVASDLDVEARRWAIGYAGISQVPVGLTATGADITVPAIGFRYWTSPRVGIDIALGFGWTGGSLQVGDESVDKNSVFGYVLQAGLPVALSTHRHVSFQLIPYAAFARGQITTNTGISEIAFSGTRIDIGARAGFELFFGFIGIPELALSATVGMQFERRKYSIDNTGVTQSDTTLVISTTVQNNPWDIFAGNVAARYYF